MKNHEPSFADRLNVAAQARRKQLEKAKAAAPTNDPEFAKRQEARREAAAAREARAAERRAAKAAEKTRKAEEKAAREAERLAAEKAEQERLESEEAESIAQAAALAVDQKAARDARYAARKARRR